MLKIGDFARLAGISSRMLRHYDRIGLLAPAQVDPATGYRWYGIEQLPRLRRLRTLQDLGFGLDEIAILLDAPAPADDVRALLAQVQATLRDRIATDQARLQRVEARLRGLDQPRAGAADGAQRAAEHLLAHHYGLPARGLTLRSSPRASDPVYEMVGADHRRWTVVLGRADAPGEHIYTTWLSGATGQVLSDFLLGRGSLLRYLEARDYPAPRLVRTGTGEILGFHDGWCALVTHERGSPLVTPTLAHMRALGDVLGRLHTLGSEDISAPVASGWLYPVQALAEALYHLATSRETAPRAWKELLGGFHATLNTIRLSRLPRTLTHGNAFAGTALVAPDAQLALRLWHPAGDGVALLDLGRLLLGCHWDPEATTPQPIVPDPRRIDAVMEGYLARRLLVPVERERLLEAIRFSIAYGAAEHLSRAHTTGWTPQLERKLAVRQQWFAASAQIAASATAALG